MEEQSTEADEMDETRSNEASLLREFQHDPCVRPKDPGVPMSPKKGRFQFEEFDAELVLIACDLGFVDSHFVFLGNL